MYIEEALPKLESRNMFTPLRPMNIPIAGEEGAQTKFDEDEYQTYDGIQPWDRLAAQIELPQSFFQRLLNGVELVSKYEVEENDIISSNQETEYKKLILFAGNDFLGLSRHPTIAKATAKAAMEQGTGPRGSPLICGYTNYHMALESSLAKLKKKEACLLCTSGFGANMAVMVAIGSIVPVICEGEGRRPAKEEKVAVFSDALNHASIVDSLKLADRFGGVKLFVYKHCDMSYLDALLYVVFYVNMISLDL
ncbi:8-amino-7-oxononanoate synthase-like [Hibiscus syriacus]|uniref:8-amino-7-oxononanoate synthase-like n=1 Tax=Hibiscus syriacus TaxID=106335 RepID=UPI001920EB92|nr:8-amino-7-oxononanoate synthase-like [Hibiscus syriacus]